MDEWSVGAPSPAETVHNAAEDLEMLAADEDVEVLATDEDVQMGSPTSESAGDSQSDRSSTSQLGSNSASMEVDDTSAHEQSPAPSASVGQVTAPPKVADVPDVSLQDDDEAHTVSLSEDRDAAHESLPDGQDAPVVNLPDNTPEVTPADDENDPDTSLPTDRNIPGVESAADEKNVTPEEDVSEDDSESSEEGPDSDEAGTTASEPDDNGTEKTAVVKDATEDAVVPPADDVSAGGSVLSDAEDDPVAVESETEEMDVEDDDEAVDEEAVDEKAVGDEAVDVEAERVAQATADDEPFLEIPEPADGQDEPDETDNAATPADPSGSLSPLTARTSSPSAPSTPAVPPRTPSPDPATIAQIEGGKSPPMARAGTPLRNLILSYGSREATPLSPSGIFVQPHQLLVGRPKQFPPPSAYDFTNTSNPPPPEPPLFELPQTDFTKALPLPPVAELPPWFNHTVRPSKLQRKRLKEGRSGKAPAEWMPLGLYRLGATVKANPVTRMIKKAPKCLGTADWKVR